MDAAHYTLVGECQTIYIRVQNAIGNAWDVTSFIIQNGYYPPVDTFPNIIECGPVILPPPAPGWGYYTGPNGTNPPIENPNHFTMYIYGNNGVCEAGTSFTVAIVPQRPCPTQDVTACSSYVLPNTSDVFYYDDPEGAGMNYMPGTSITTTLQGVNFSVHTSLEQAQQNQGALDYEQPIAINSAQTVSVRVSNGGDCFSIVI